MADMTQPRGLCTESFKRQAITFSRAYSYYLDGFERYNSVARNFAGGQNDGNK